MLGDIAAMSEEKAGHALKERTGREQITHASAAHLKYSNAPHGPRHDDRPSGP